MTLVNRTVQVSSVHLHDTWSVCCIVRPPPKGTSCPVTMFWPLYPLLSPLPSVTPTIPTSPHLVSYPFLGRSESHAWPHFLPKASLPDVITMGVRDAADAFCGDTNIKFTATCLGDATLFTVVILIFSSTILLFISCLSCLVFFCSHVSLFLPSLG